VAKSRWWGLSPANRGLIIYGFGEQKVGSVEGSWLFIGAMILSSSAAGLLAGEWHLAGTRAKLVLCAGSLIIFLLGSLREWRTAGNPMHTEIMRISRLAKAVSQAEKPRPNYSLPALIANRACGNSGADAERNIRILNRLEGRIEPKGCRE